MMCVCVGGGVESTCRQNLLLYMTLYSNTLTPLFLSLCVCVCVCCSTVRVWSEDGQCVVMEAHSPAVWTIAGLYQFDGTRRVLSGELAI